MLSVTSPTAGVLQIFAGVEVLSQGSLVIPNPDGVLQIQGALALTPLPSGCSIAAPAGPVPLLGAVVIGYIDGSGIFQQGFAP